MHRRLRLLCLLLLTTACVTPDGGAEGTPAEPPETDVTVPGTSSTTTPLESPSGAEILVATTAEEYADIAIALDAAAERWASGAPHTYAYRLQIDCECVDRGTSWVRVFDPDWPDEVPWDVELLHARISAAIDRAPRRIEVAFDPELGFPVWFSVDGTESEMFLVDEFHEITPTATPYDGAWRFVEGEIDGERFGNPTSGLIAAELRDGYITFPIDCNEAGGQIDVHGSFFGVGPVFTTAVGCSEYSEEGELFGQALEGATMIGEDGAELVLSGEDGLLRLVPLERPDYRGELPITAAGETLVIDVDERHPSSISTISSGSHRPWPDGHPGRSVLYTLTPVVPGSGQNPTWSPWRGELEVHDLPSGPLEIVIPDDIRVGDYRLCSPYWSGDFFCYELPIRPASAPWYVTAGADGVVLHDADSTSQPVWEGGAHIAFWFDDLLVVETVTGAILAVRDSGPDVELSEEGSRLLDVQEDAGSKQVLMVKGGETLALDANSGEETPLGPAAIEGRLAGDIVVFRPSPDMIEARSTADGAVIWQLGVDPEEMISSVTQTEVRLDSGQINNTDGPVPFWQYLETRIIESRTGDLVDEFRVELAIPLEGDQITDPCMRAELREGLLLCPQPDGRFATIEVEGGEQQTVTGLTDVLATYVR